MRSPSEKRGAYAKKPDSPSKRAQKQGQGKKRSEIEREYKKLLTSIITDSERDAEVPLQLPTDLGMLLVKREDGTFSPSNALLDDIQAEGEYFAFDTAGVVCA